MDEAKLFLAEQCPLKDEKGLIYQTMFSIFYILKLLLMKFDQF